MRALQFSVALVVNLSLVLSLSSPAALAQINDFLASAVDVGSVPYSDTLTNVDATFEAGEPFSTCGTDGLNSIWWRYTPASSGTLVANTFGSDFDTILSVYRVMSGLVLEGCNNDSGGTMQSKVEFSATGGSTYYFRIIGYAGAEGEVHFNLGPPTTTIDDAIEIVSLPYSGSQSNTGAASDPGESSATCGSSSTENSVWWRYTATDTVRVTADTYDSGFNTILSVHRGVGHPLAEDGCDDDSGEPQYRSSLTFTALKDSTYFFRVVGSGSEEGTVNFNLRPSVAFAGKVLLEGPYSSGGMMLQEAAFTTARPSTQPYSDAQYNGTDHEFDGVDDAIPYPGSSVDWVVAHLRTGTSAATAVAGSEVVMLVGTDGSLTNANGDSVRFFVEPGSYYLVLRHRNHLSIMTSAAVDFSTTVGTWDFTTASSQAFGTSPMTEPETGVWAMFAAEANLDDLNNAGDFNLWLTDTKAGANGYQTTDFNLDGQVTAGDFNLWLANTKVGATSAVP